MRPVRFLEQARDEFLEQVAYYETQQKGLGDRFRECVEVAVVSAAANPRLAADNYPERRIDSSVLLPLMPRCLM